jgi:hypothetical protein
MVALSIKMLNKKNRALLAMTHICAQGLVKLFTSTGMIRRQSILGCGSLSTAAIGKVP